VTDLLTEWLPLCAAMGVASCLLAVPIAAVSWVRSAGRLFG